MTVTLHDMQRTVKRRLLGSFREPVTSLAVAITDNTTSSMSLTSAPATLGVESVLSIDNELAFVQAWDPSTRIATVIRGYLTDPASHPIGSVVEVNSRFPSATIYDTLRDQFLALPRGIFSAVDTGYIGTAGNGVGQYLVDVSTPANVTEADVYGILEASIDKPDNSMSWAVAVAAMEQPVKWARLTDTRLIRMRYPTNSDPMKVIVRLGRNAGVQWDAVNLNFKLMCRPQLTAFTPTTTLTDIGLNDSIGMPIVLGTMIQLWGDQEIKRTARGPAGESRRPEEVPAGLLMSDVKSMREVYDRLISVESDKLRSKYPFRWT